MRGIIEIRRLYMGGIRMKIDLTERAQEELKKVMDSRKDKKPLRIYIAGYG